MKTFLLAALLAGVATSAFASDLPSRKAPPAMSPIYAPPAFSWTGFYVGVNGGFGYGGLSDTNFSSPSGGVVGGTAGYNYQFGQFVVGVEADLDWADLHRTNSFVNGTNKFSIDTMTTERLRLGYAADRALFYITGGYAGMETTGSVHDTVYSNYASQDTWRNGGVIGGGVEYAFTNNISAKAEYLYAPMESKSYFSGTPDAEKNGLDVSLFRLGLNYKF
jgi:outer membrane immunogenic protein